MIQILLTGNVISGHQNTRKNGGKPGCACAHPREPLRGHITSGSHGSCTTVVLLY